MKRDAQAELSDACNKFWAVVEPALQEFMLSGYYTDAVITSGGDLTDENGRLKTVFNLAIKCEMKARHS